MQGPIPPQIQGAGALSDIGQEAQSSPATAGVVTVSRYLPWCSVLQMGLLTTSLVWKSMQGIWEH